MRVCWGRPISGFPRLCWHIDVILGSTISKVWFKHGAGNRGAPVLKRTRGNQGYSKLPTFFVGRNSSLCTVPFLPFLKCPSAMPFLKCPSAMPFLNCPSRIRFLKMPFLNDFPPKDALPQNSFPKKCPSLTCPPTIPHQRQCKHCND